MRTVALVTALVVSSALAGPAAAWGDKGHAIVAWIAYRHLTPGAKHNADLLLAADNDTMTARDIGSRATWADRWKYSDNHGPRYLATSKWHFTDLEIDQNGMNLDQACSGHPAPGPLASAGPAADCAVDKINQFAAEVRNVHAPLPERILAFKYLLHLVGDLHQPLHSFDNHDSGGNCEVVTYGGSSMKLHAYWDDAVVSDLPADPATAAAALDAAITPAQAAQWGQGTDAAWAMESFRAAQSAFSPALAALCVGGKSNGSMAIDANYDRSARVLAKLQLQKAGIRLAAVLNTVLQ